MSRWIDIESAAPELAARARALLDAHGHKTIATLRADGSPRISGTEATFVDGDLWIGSMPGARKAVDLRRDGRFALHSASEVPERWSADAKLAGRAELVDDPARRASLVAAQAAAAGREHEAGSDPGEFELFRLDVDEVVVTGLDDAREQLVVSWWTSTGGLRRTTR